MALETIDHIFEIGFRLLLWVLYLYLNQLAPYVRHIEEEEVWYYRYPSVDSIIPVYYLYIIMSVVPFIVFFTHFICSKRNSRLTVLKSHFYGISLAYVINGIFTATLKLIVGRPRPNFFYRCFPDGVGIHIENCTGEWDGQMDGRKSFPSAHSSFSFAGMVYITCYLFNEFDFSEPRFGRGIMFFLSLMPMLLAVVVALSRACDYHHHFSDILGGGLLGTAIALIVFQCYSDFSEEKQQRYYENIRKLQVATTGE